MDIEPKKDVKEEEGFKSGPQQKAMEVKLLCKDYCTRVKPPKETIRTPH